MEGGLDAAVGIPSASVDMPSASVDMPSASVDMPIASVDMPSADVSGKTPDMPSVGGKISGDLPSVDAKLTGPDVEGGGVSLGAGLAAGVTAAVGATAAGLGLSGKADKPDVEVRLLYFMVCFIGHVCCYRCPWRSATALTKDPFFAGIWHSRVLYSTRFDVLFAPLVARSRP